MGKGLALVCGVVAVVSVVNGQEFRATLTGRVLDSAGAAIPKAKIRVTNAANGESRETVTDAQGSYLLPLLNPATYSIRAERDGFKTSVKEGLHLAVNQTATVD